MTDKDESCVQPAGGPIGQPEEEASTPDKRSTHGEVPKVTVQVGKPAPDFEATAYVDGGFKTMKLSDYKGQWVTLCFYPGDFTFV